MHNLLTNQVGPLHLLRRVIQTANIDRIVNIEILRDLESSMRAWLVARDGHSLVPIIYGLSMLSRLPV